MTKVFHSLPETDFAETMEKFVESWLLSILFEKYGAASF